MEMWTRIDYLQLVWRDLQGRQARRHAGQQGLWAKLCVQVPLPVCNGRRPSV